MTFVLTALAAAVAVAVELVEAMAIVLAVGVSRRWRDAVWGAVAGVVACVALALLLGPLLDGLPRDALRIVIGTLLLLYGLEWLRKGTLRLSGRKRRSSCVREFDETVEELEDSALPPEGQADWAGRIVAFKGVLLEGSRWSSSSRRWRRGRAVRCPRCSARGSRSSSWRSRGPGCARPWRGSPRRS